MNDRIVKVINTVHIYIVEECWDNVTIGDIHGVVEIYIINREKRLRNPSRLIILLVAA